MGDSEFLRRCFMVPFVVKKSPEPVNWTRIHASASKALSAVCEQHAAWLSLAQADVVHCHSKCP